MLKKENDIEKIIIKKKDYDKQIYNELLKEEKYSKEICFLLAQRPKLYEEIKNKKLEKKEIKNARQLSEKIIEIIKTEPKKLILYTDYDNDGYSGGFIFLDFIKNKYNVEVDFHINDRFKEGYGLNKEVIKKIANKGYKYILTVDLGISNIDEIKLANELGLTVLLTDHHLPKIDKEGNEILPPAEIIVNVQVEGNDYEKGVCGAYTIWHVLEFIDKELAQNYLDNVALALLSDNMPMNKKLVREYVKKGIEYINQNKISNPFVKEIIKRYREEKRKNKLDEMDLGFYITPLINAVGRLDNVYNLMKWTRENNLEKVDFVKELNETRKELTRTFSIEGLKKAEKSIKEGNNILLIDFKNCPEGIVGLIASRICEKYKKPTIVATLDEEGNRYKASGRSKNNYDFSNFFIDEKIKFIVNQEQEFDDEDEEERLLRKLKKMEKKGISNNLVVGGGHKYACGMSFEKKNLNLLKERLKEIKQPEIFTVEVEGIIEKDPNIPENIFSSKIKYQFGVNFIEEYKKVLSPFGQENEEPTFVLKGKIENLTFLGKEQLHVKFTINGITCIAFNIENKILKNIENYNVIGTFTINEFQNKKNVQFLVKDFFI